MTFGVIRSNKRRASSGCIQNTTNHVATTTALHIRRNTSASPIRWVNSDDRPIRPSSGKNFGTSERFLKPKEFAHQECHDFAEGSLSDRFLDGSDSSEIPADPY